MIDKGYILLAAGGTGGHLFPAEALAHALKVREYKIVLATDERADKFAGSFPADHKVIITSATMGSKNPIAIAKMFWKLFQGYCQSTALISKYQPVAAVGFGGYPTLPPILAATRKGIPALVHEQNAILGRANRLLARKIKGIAVGFDQVGKKPNLPILVTGNPIRPSVEAVMEVPYPQRQENQPFKLVVFGGSQGARFFSEVLPEALAKLTPRQRQLFKIVQQAREEDMATLKSSYSEMGIDADIAPFFSNMPEAIAKAHFVIARAGAGSVTEIAVIGRPSLLVPLPGSLDGDQAANAAAIGQAGGAFVVQQSQLTGERLAEILSEALEHPFDMEKMSKAAKSTGVGDAAKRLADCVEYVISGGELSALEFKAGNTL